MLVQRTSQGWFKASTAMVIGDVQIAPDVSIWFGAVVRGDVARIVLGARTNVQDNAVIHCDSGVSNVIGQDVVIGHGAIVHGKAVGDRTLIGMGATLLGRSDIGKDCVVAAGALVPPGMVVLDGSLVMGVPARVVREVNEKDRTYVRWLSSHYVELARRYVEGDFSEVSSGLPDFR